MKSARMMFLAFLLVTPPMLAQNPIADTTIVFEPSQPDLVRENSHQNTPDAWGFDIMLSNNGFGAGGFYRHEFSDDLSGIVTLAISDVKDDAEFEQYDLIGGSFVFGKKNRLMMFPLMAAVEYRLFREEIMDNFRPYISSGIGPTMMFVAPYSYTDTFSDSSGGFYAFPKEVEFFESLGRGQAKYSIGGFLAAGAYFGSVYGMITGLSVRYYYVHFPQGIEVMENAKLKTFGGLYITLTIGTF